MSSADQLTEHLTGIASRADFRDVDAGVLLSTHRTRQWRRAAVIASALSLAILAGGLAIAGGGMRPPDKVSVFTNDPSKVRPEGPYGLFNATMTPAERRVITRGLITNVDYQRFVQASVDCLRAKGFTTRGPYWENGRLSYNYGYSTPPRPGERDFRQVAKAVRERWGWDCGTLSDSISTAWLVDHGLMHYPPLEARIAAMRRGEL